MIDFKSEIFRFVIILRRTFFLNLFGTEFQACQSISKRIRKEFDRPLVYFMIHVLNEDTNSEKQKREKCDEISWIFILNN